VLEGYFHLKLLKEKMKEFLSLCLVVVFVGHSESSGAGRAYPVLTENYVVDLFQKINPRLEWDKSNFLVDLSGNYANCDFINTRGFVKVDRRTPQGESIEAIVDYTDGAETHTKAVDSYIRPVMDRWTTTTFPDNFRSQISTAKKFACSVRPGCNGRVSVACLFSPSYRGDPYTPPPYRSTAEPTRRTYPPYTRPPYTTPRATLPPVTGEQHALAFTPEQYKVAEGISGQVWDRSHLLENLSGYETDCSLIDKRYWDFPTATAIAQQRGMTIAGLFGSAPNEGSTPDALRKILSDLKDSDASRGLLGGYFSPGAPGIKETGCSVIPDCIKRDPFGSGYQMYVVVACVFEL
jgi:hypothetical protein